MQVIDTAGVILNSTFVETPRPQANLHLTTLQKSAPQKRSCSVSFPQKFHTRVAMFLTGEKVAPTLNKKDVVASWKAITNLYLVDYEDFHKYCDARQPANPVRVPFLDVLCHTKRLSAAA